jgi:thioesterase domain-containing protein
VVREARERLDLEETVRRTPEVSLKEVFSRAAAGLDDGRAEVVAEALDWLQRGFDSHYAADATDDDLLVGDNAYAQAVETIARLDEPRFVGVASRMIRDGAGLIAAGKGVTLELWTPHLGGLLDIISGEGQERSEARIREAAEKVRRRDG